MTKGTEEWGNPQITAHYQEALSWERIDFNLDNE